MRVLFASASTIFYLILWSQNPSPSAHKVGEPQQQHANSAQDATRNDQRGTDQSPLVVKTLPTLKTQAETNQATEDRKQKTANDRRIVVFTGILAVVAIFQLVVYGYQAKKLRETVKSAGEQAEAMERHIGEAARSANAMENIAIAIQAGNQAVMRAYLAVVVGHAIYQERRVGQSDLKFEGKPNLVNTGNTQARNVRIRTNAAVLPIPPQNFDYPLPDEVTESPGSSVGAHQTYILSCMVKDFVSDSDVALVKEGTGKALFAWGLITYEDIFGQTHNTRFGQWLTWLPDGKVFGYYIPGQNDAD